MNNAKYIVLLAIVSAQHSIAAASEFTIECPETIESAESIKAVSDSWHVEQDLGKRGRFIDSISVYSGNPNEMGSLVPDKETQKDRKRIYTWDFNEQSSEEFWVACTYTNSMLMLTKPLPKNVRKCELTERLLKTGVKLSIESMKCEIK